MDSKRAYKFRINPDLKRKAEIDLQLILAKNLYNSLLGKSIKEYEKDKKSKISRKALNQMMKEAVAENPDYKKLYSQTRQDVQNRLIRAYQNFFNRVARKRKGEKIEVGFPRIKSRRTYFSLTYPQDNGSFRLEKEKKIDLLRISRVGRVRIELHRPIEGKIKTMTIKREAGNYYAIFTAIKEVKVPNVINSNPIGIDVGLETFATLSDGTKIQKPNFKRNCHKRIALWQRRVARKVKGSNRKNKAKLKLQREYAVSTNQQNDYLNKITDKLINSSYTSFAVEKLQINDMVKNRRYARSINEASWNKFIQLLSYKAESAGMEVISVNPENTTKTCGNCGSIKDMPISLREYDCPDCGFHEDRDINAAINILNRATFGLKGSYAQGDDIRPLAREAVVGELRTYSESGVRP